VKASNSGIMESGSGSPVKYASAIGMPLAPTGQRDFPIGTPSELWKSRYWEVI